MQTIVLPNIATIRADFPQIGFKESASCYYSAREKCIFYIPKQLHSKPGVFQLLHEVGHALESHHHFESGIELLKMEAEAWRRAKHIAKQYGLAIPSELIEHCLDSYRDWLHVRSTCPNCGNIAIESGPNEYHCFNCKQKWSVSGDQRSRCYRLKLDTSS